MKLGVLVNNLGPSQLAFNIIKNVNQSTGFDFIAFYENFLRPCIPMNFATMQIYEAWGYDGILIATKLSNAAQLVKFPLAKNKFFYVWDLEWLYAKEKYFRYLQGIYANPELKLIARSQSHKDLIEDCWNVKVAGIVDDFNIKQLKEVAQW